MLCILAHYAKELICTQWNLFCVLNKCTLFILYFSFSFVCHRPPEIKLKNVTGLSNENVQSLTSGLEDLATQLCGEVILFILRVMADLVCLHILLENIGKCLFCMYSTDLSRIWLLWTMAHSLGFEPSLNKAFIHNSLPNQIPVLIHSPTLEG